MNGQRFGSLTVKAKAASTTHGNKRWLCLCDCGTQTTARAADIRNGKITKCRACRRGAERPRP